ncbi:hypothetical protein ACKWTF_011034 [Chironomus riparius]
MDILSLIVLISVVSLLTICLICGCSSVRRNRYPPVTIISQCPPNQPCRQNQNAFIPAQPMQLPVYTQNVQMPMQYPGNNPQPSQNYPNVQQPMMPLQYNQPTNYYNMNRI